MFKRDKNEVDSCQHAVSLSQIETRKAGYFLVFVCLFFCLNGNAAALSCYDQFYASAPLKRSIEIKFSHGIPNAVRPAITQIVPEFSATISDNLRDLISSKVITFKRSNPNDFYWGDSAEPIENSINLSKSSFKLDVEMEKVFRRDLLQTSNPDFEPYLTFDSFKRGSGLHGGDLTFLVKRKGSPWESRDRVNEDLTPNPSSAITQGNPAFFVTLMGSEKAKFWGFHTPVDEVVTLPDAKELQGAIDKINSKIESSHRRIKIRFYNTAGIVPERQYLSGFISNRNLPIALKGILSVHDKSVHPAHIFNEPEFDQLYVNRVKAKMAFYKRIEQELPELYKKIERWFVESDLNAESGRIDMVSAAITDMFTDYIHNGGNPGGSLFENSVSRIWNFYLKKGVSPQESTLRFTRSVVNHYGRDSAEAKKILSLFNDFDRTANEELPGYGQGLAMTKDDIFPRIFARFKEIEVLTPAN